MDSLTQAVLGAAVGEAVLGRKAGRKAALWGAALGTLPDLDVFVPMGHAVNSFTWHRGPSHSLFVLGLLTPFCAWLLQRCHHRSGMTWRDGVWLAGLVFLTHVLLDALTVYGTQLFWPVWPYPVGLNSIFIIDPLYTLPLLAAVIYTMAFRNNRARAVRFSRFALVVSTLYLGWSVAAQTLVKTQVRQDLANQGIHPERLLVTPTPFNTLVWRILAVEGPFYHEAFTGILSLSEPLVTTRYERLGVEPQLLAQLPAFRRLAWFAKGFYSLQLIDQKVVMSDLRMGMEPNYVFRFALAEQSSAGLTPIVPEHLSSSFRLKDLKETWKGKPGPGRPTVSESTSPLPPMRSQSGWDSAGPAFDPTP